MKDIISSLIDWKENGKRAALATVLQTWGSSPRQPGAHMVVEENGAFFGSVSGGCVEAAVVQESLEVIAIGKTKRIKYGIEDDVAWSVGLACGGEIEIFISPIVWDGISPILNKIIVGDPCWYQINLDEKGDISQYPLNSHELNFPYLDQSSSPEKLILFASPDPQLIIVGGVNISQHLVNFSKLLGYKITIIDPRRSFANPHRFPLVDHIENVWPEDAFKKIDITLNTAIVVLTHDDKIDIPALMFALESPAYYIGALGSKSTQIRRKAALLELGVAREKLSRIHGPIGLEIGAKDPLEIALAITSEIIAVANQKMSSPQPQKEKTEGT